MVDTYATSSHVAVANCGPNRFEASSSKGRSRKTSGTFEIKLAKINTCAAQRHRSSGTQSRAKRQFIACSETGKVSQYFMHMRAEKLR